MGKFLTVETELISPCGCKVEFRQPKQKRLLDNGISLLTAEDIETAEIAPGAGHGAPGSPWPQDPCASVEILAGKSNILFVNNKAVIEDALSVKFDNCPSPATVVPRTSQRLGT